MFTLLEEDLRISEEPGGPVIQVRIKWPKEEKHRREFTVEVFETGGANCPVKALRKWWASGPPRERGSPAFRRPDGAAFMGRRLNENMDRLLEKQLGAGRKRLKTHSFRAAVPSMLVFLASKLETRTTCTQVMQMVHCPRYYFWYTVLCTMLCVLVHKAHIPGIPES